MLLMDDSFPVRILKPLPGLCATLAAIAVGIVFNELIYPDHGRIAVFSSLMSILVVYSCTNMLGVTSVSIFVIVYIALHWSLCLIGAFSDDAYYGAVLIPAAILDYIAMIYIVSFLYRQRRT